MDETTFAVLKAEIEDRHADLARMYERLGQRRTDFRKSAEGVESMGYQLHNLYSAFEQFFETIARFFENRIEGERYHTDLLRRMKMEIEGIRPALISAEAFALLDELRRFRHFFRHAYAAELDPDKVEEIAEKAEQVKGIFQRDKDAFLAQLAP
jgi:hypothetical protein